jgi:hypothetical protein
MVVDGGLMTAEAGWSLGPELLVNRDFSQGASGWSFQPNCFTIDPTTPGPSGGASPLFNNPSNCSHTPIAVNSYKIGGGAVYTISGQLKNATLYGTGN